MGWIKGKPHSKETCRKISESIRRARCVDRTGERYGSLTVMGPGGRNKDDVLLWKVRCVCGKEKTVRNDNLTALKSCGCSQAPRVLTLLNSLWDRYKKNALERRILFLLTRERFDFLVSQNCHYCGDPPSTPIKNYGVIPLSHNYNGVDRLDSNLGYMIENCVSCCKTCNRAKGSLSLEEFEIWAQRLVRELERKCLSFPPLH